jgi:hypothetical protein
MTNTLLSVRVGPMDVSRAARRSGFIGTDSRASVIRYSLARLAGYNHDDARNIAMKLPIGADAGMKVSGSNIKATVDSELVELAKSRIPEPMDQSTMVRYALALAAEFPHDEAMDEAKRVIGRPRKVTA